MTSIMFIPNSHAGCPYPIYPTEGKQAFPGLEMTHHVMLVRTEIHPWCFSSSNINGQFYLVMKMMAPPAFTTIWGLVGRLSNGNLSFFTSVPVTMSGSPTLR